MFAANSKQEVWWTKSYWKDKSRVKWQWGFDQFVLHCRELSPTRPDREIIFTPKLLHSHYWDSPCRQQSMKHKRFNMDWQVVFVSIWSEHKNKTCMQERCHYYLAQASWNSATIEIRGDSVLPIPDVCSQCWHLFFRSVIGIGDLCRK